MKKNVAKRTTITNTPAGTDQTEMIRQDFYGDPDDGVVTNSKPMPTEATFRDSIYNKKDQS